MHTIETDLGAIVKRARINKGLTQEELAEKAGVGLRHFQGIENEGSYPSYEVLYKVVRELNINAGEIFFPENHTSNTRLEYLIRLLGRCSDRDIRLLTELAEAMLDEMEEN